MKKSLLIFGALVIVLPAAFFFGKKMASWNVTKVRPEAQLAGATQVPGIAPSSTAPAAVPGKITLVFTGDIMLSRAIGQNMAGENDWLFPFRRMSDVTRAADITFGNLEGPISTRGTLAGSAYSFRSDPRVAEGLVYAGFNIVSIANNHIWDYGPEAFTDTLTVLGSAGIAAVGGGADYAAAHAPVIKDIRGTKIAYLAYTDLVPRSRTLEGSRPATAYPDAIKEDVKKASASADIVIVSFHFGEEYQAVHNAHQEELAKAAIDAGASLVIGHHPHTPEDVEKYGGGYIFYSLGNFVFDQNFDESTKTGLVARVILEGKAITKVEAIKIGFTSSYQPYPIP